MSEAFAPFAEQYIGKIPFYCAAWSNIRSARNAVASGFRPAWVEMTAKSEAFVEKLSKGE